MKKTLLSDGLGRYKANLHCHSDLSDGALSPRELKELYKSRGYAAVAFTDHNLFLPHNDLSDPEFLALNGVEMDFGHAVDPREKTCHIGMIALSPEQRLAPGSGRGEHLWGRAAQLKDRMAFDPAQPRYDRRYSPEGVNDLMRRGREMGFFVTYNHPLWSLEDWREYSRYTEMDAVEIFKYDAFIAGYPDADERVLEDLLSQGKRVFCTASDDNHNHLDPADPQFDSFGGFTVLFAERLDYPALAAALKEGRFYSVSGFADGPKPEILGLWAEDGRVTLRARGARFAALQLGARKAEKQLCDPAVAADYTFVLPPEADWFRLTLQDDAGHRAFTNPYFTADL